MSVQMYSKIEVVQANGLRANIMSTLSGKSVVVEIWLDAKRLDVRRRKSIEAARKAAGELLKFWAPCAQETPAAAKRESA